MYRPHPIYVVAVICALMALLSSRLIGGEADPKPQLLEPGDGPGKEEELAPRSIAEVVDVIAETVQLQTGAPRAKVSIDGDVYPGCWLKLSGSAVLPGGTTLSEVEWSQKAGPKLTVTKAELKREELWLFLMKTGSYAFSFRARNEKGWSNPVEVRFAILPGRAYVNEQDGYQLTGSGEKIVLPGGGWRQVAGPQCVLRPAEQGVAVRLSDAGGLYVFEAPRLDGVPERRGVRVPPAKDGVLGDRRPIARMARNMAGAVNQALELDGTLSMDPDAGETEKLVAKWSTPDTSRGVELTPRPGIAALFKAHKPGSYSVSLTVSDGKLESAPETVFIDIQAGRDGASVDGSDDADDPAGDPRARRVSLAILPLEPLADGSMYVLEDSGLERAVQQFPNRCRMALLVDPEVARPGQFKDFPLTLAAENTPLQHLIDGVARQTGTRYWVDSGRAFWLVKPTAFFSRDKMEPVAVGADALCEKQDGSDFLQLLKTYLKPALDAREGASVNYDPRRQEVVGVLPAGACNRLKEIAGALREPAGLGLPQFSQPTKEELRLKRWLGEKSITARGRYRLDRLLREISEKTGVALGYDPRDFAKRAPPFVNVKFENTPLRQIARDIAAEAGFDGVSVEEPAGIWFYKGSRPYPGAELFSETAVVRAYDLSSIYAVLTPEAAALLSGETIAYAVRSRVFPASWNDNGTLITYHNPTGKLLVIHTPLAQRRVLEVLADLRERGEWALGPSE